MGVFTTRRRRSTRCAALAAIAVAAVPAGALLATAPPPETPQPETPPPDTSFLRGQAEAAFAAEVPGITGVACAPPPADEAGVSFLCYGVAADSTVVVRLATVNDDGGIGFSDASVGSTSLEDGTPPATTLPAPIEGSGNQAVAPIAVSGPSIVAVTHDGAGGFSLQPQRSGVAVGTPTVSTSGPVNGRYLVGLDGAFDSYGVVADGAWTIQLQPTTSAVPLAVDAPAGGSGPDVVRFESTADAAATVTFDGAGPFTMAAVTSAGSVALVEADGSYTGPVALPAGPGFVVVNGSGPWTITLDAAGETAAPTG